VNDPFDLQRFVDAQDQDAGFGQVLAELRQGQKRGHWMWFVFPQIQGLGRSWDSEKFAISSRDEAEAYLQHPILGSRLRECTRLVTLVEGRSSEQIFGTIDALKFRSSLTLFAHATTDNKVFRDALDKYFGGQFDPLTLMRL
jgi:uncharacterized protein (DUF1810 family)